MLPLLAAALLQVPQLPKDGATFSGRVLKQVSVSYLVSLPEGYDPQGDKSYPVLVFLHGSGERGTDLNLVRRHGPPKEVAKGRKFPFIIISPQCPDGQWWDVDALGGMIKKVERDYKIDRRREYLTGISMGGYGAWAWAIAEPRRFAAVAPICGGGDDSLVDKIRTVPVWAFHGDADQSVPIAEDQKMVDALQDAGGNVKFTVVKGGQHDIWSDIYAGTEIFDWLLSHRR